MKKQQHQQQEAAEESEEQIPPGTPFEYGIGANSDEEGQDEEAADAAFLEVASKRANGKFEPFQAAANVMPYNMATDMGHNFMNPYLRGYNPHYDGFTPQPGGHLWNNPNGPYWSPFHWSAPSSYWSVYPPQYASHYVEPGFYGRPYDHNHMHGHDSSFPHYPFHQSHGSMDPHVYGPHLDWPFGGAIYDINHIPGLGTGENEKAPFPQFRQVFDKEEAETDESEESADAESVVGADAAAEADSKSADGLDYEVDATNHVIPHKQACVNCLFHDG